MNCNCCDYYDFGCYNHNEDVNLPMFAVIGGNYIFKFDSAFSHKEFKLFIAGGEELYIPKEWDLNENMNYELKIVDCLGNSISYEDETCFAIKFIINNTDICIDDDYAYYCG